MARLNTLQRNIVASVKRAKSIHGHLGPFLVLGVRISIAGMEKLGIEKNDGKLRVEAEMPYIIPYTCTLDGIQATTQCTFGNQKLVFKESSSPTVSVKFSLKDKNNQVVVSVKNEILHNLIDRLKEAKGDEKVQNELALTVATMPEENLFYIKVK